MANSITKEEVESFLNRFYQKVKVFDIIFRNDRTKNIDTLAELEISPAQRKKIVLELSAEDFVEGPIEDTLNKLGEMWVFGKDVKGREVYIKIQLGKINSSTICISFHIAEYPLNYQFRNA